jgi:hypothetical protein
MSAKFTDLGNGTHVRMDMVAAFKVVQTADGVEATTIYYAGGHVNTTGDHAAALTGAKKPAARKRAESPAAPGTPGAPGAPEGVAKKPRAPRTPKTPAVAGATAAAGTSGTPATGAEGEAAPKKLRAPRKKADAAPAN